MQRRGAERDTRIMIPGGTHELTNLETSERAIIVVKKVGGTICGWAFSHRVWDRGRPSLHCYQLMLGRMFPD